MGDLPQREDGIAGVVLDKGEEEEDDRITGKLAAGGLESAAGGGKLADGAEG